MNVSRHRNIAYVNFRFGTLSVPVPVLLVSGVPGKGHEGANMENVKMVTGQDPSLDARDRVGGSEGHARAASVVQEHWAQSAVAAPRSQLLH